MYRIILIVVSTMLRVLHHHSYDALSLLAGVRACFSHHIDDGMTPERDQPSLGVEAGPSTLLSIQRMIILNHTLPFNYREKYFSHPVPSPYSRKNGQTCIFYVYNKMHCDCQIQDLASNYAFQKAHMKVTQFCGVYDSAIKLEENNSQVVILKRVNVMEQCWKKPCWLNLSC